jgi:hypothetical protein
MIEGKLTAGNITLNSDGYMYSNNLIAKTKKLILQKRNISFYDMKSNLEPDKRLLWSKDITTQYTVVVPNNSIYFTPIDDSKILNNVLLDNSAEIKQILAASNIKFDDVKVINKLIETIEEVNND